MHDRHGHIKDAGWVIMSHSEKSCNRVAALGPRGQCPQFSFYCFPNPSTLCLSSNCNLHLDTSLDIDDDLLDNLSRGSQVDQALVDAHLVAVPGLGTLTAGGLAGLYMALLVVLYVLSETGEDVR